ncbi:hypothetical protein MHYP_G00013890 [Metynnis hypsauchen]
MWSPQCSKNKPKQTHGKGEVRGALPLTLTLQSASDRASFLSGRQSELLWTGYEGLCSRQHSPKLNMAWSRRPPASTALLLLSCLLCRGVSPQRPQRPQVSVNEISGFSLSPPYFNLAEGSAISATATCGEDQQSRPRSDLYCKLVGGPAIGVPSQTIQVKRRAGAPACGGELWSALWSV